MRVYNVIFKPTHLSPSHVTAKVFATEEQADSWINKKCEASNLRITSRMGWDENHTQDDRFCMDADGNYYYFIILAQEITLP